jgi:hypothetical protein
MAVTLTAATIAAIDTYHATPGDTQNTEIRTALTAALVDITANDTDLDTAIKTAEVAISSAEIVGTASGDLGHADGVEIVAAPGAGFALQFIDAVIIYDYDTAAYTDGAGDDLGFFINSVAVSPSIATADLITKAGDTVISTSALATDYVLGVNSNINLACTAVTDPGTAAGVIRVKVRYRTITTGL